MPLGNVWLCKSRPHQYFSPKKSSAKCESFVLELQQTRAIPEEDMVGYNCKVQNQGQVKARPESVMSLKWALTKSRLSPNEIEINSRSKTENH